MPWYDLIPQELTVNRPGGEGGPRQIQFGWGTHSL